MALDMRAEVKTGRRKAGLSEGEHQVWVMEWARKLKRPELKWLHHVPNGGKRDKRTAARLKREGVKAGVSDLFLPVPTDSHNGLYIELKTETGRATDSQKGFIEDMNRVGYMAVVCKGREEAVRAIEGYLGWEVTARPWRV